MDSSPSGPPRSPGRGSLRRGLLERERRVARRDPLQDDLGDGPRPGEGQRSRDVQEHVSRLTRPSAAPPSGRTGRTATTAAIAGSNWMRARGRSRSCRRWPGRAIDLCSPGASEMLSGSKSKTALAAHRRRTPEIPEGRPGGAAGRRLWAGGRNGSVGMPPGARFCGAGVVAGCGVRGGAGTAPRPKSKGPAPAGTRSAASPGRRCSRPSRRTRA